MTKATDSLARFPPVELAAIFRLRLCSSANKPPMRGPPPLALPDASIRVNGSQDAVVSQFKFLQWMGKPSFAQIA